MISATNGTVSAGLASFPAGDIEAFEVLSSGIYAANTDGDLYTFDSTSSTWNLILSSSTSSAVYDLHEENNVLYLATDNGVDRYDLSTNQALSSWNSGNVLHSDTITQITSAGNQLLFSSPDNGLARFNWNSGFWLATWNDGNWLASNTVSGAQAYQDTLHIMSGDQLHRYDLSTGVFGTSIDLSQMNLSENDANMMMPWSPVGARAPSAMMHAMTDGSRLVLINATMQSTMQREIVIASGPSSYTMTDALEHDGILYVAGYTSEQVDRFDIANSLWLTSIDTGDIITTLGKAGDTILAGTANDGVFLIEDGAIRASVPAGSDTPNPSILSLAAAGDCSDVQGCNIISTQSGGVYRIDADSTAVGSATLLSEGSMIGQDIAIYAGICYVATTDGLLRYEIVNDTFLAPWGSTGVNGVDNAPVAVIGDIVHMGLAGYGVARKNLLTGEILTPLNTDTTSMQTNTIYALEASGNDLWIGTNIAGYIWDGFSVSETTIGPRSDWTKRPSQHFDYVLDGNAMWSGTNIGVCKYDLSGNIADCLNVYDGMPNWATYAVDVNSTTVFGGTFSGVGLIEKSSFSVVDVWDAGEQTDNAVVEIIDDIAYIGLNGVGVARWDISNSQWLTTWTTSNVLDNGNQFVTSMIEDIRPGFIWIGGEDGFQLINTTTGAEAYDIETSNSLYVGNGDPYDLTLYGYTMYYHQGASSDSIYGIDVGNFTAITPLDAGQEVNENGGDVVSMTIVGDTLLASVVSGQWWNADGSGGIAQYDLTSNSWNSSILPEGAVDRVTAFNSSTGHTWISWGEIGLEVYSPSGTKLGSWDTLSFPVREIIEYDGLILFATEDGVERFNESSFQWETAWTPGNGLPNAMGDWIGELWTDGTNLVVGSASFAGWGGFQRGTIGQLDATGTWTTYTTGQNGIPNGYPISMNACGSYLYVGLFNNNGGVTYIDLANTTAVGSFTTSVLKSGRVAAVACDSADTLYVGYDADNQPISKYDTTQSAWITEITTNGNGIPGDPVWLDAFSYADGKLLIGYDENGGFAAISTLGPISGQASMQSVGTPVTSIKYSGNEWLIGQAGGASGYSHVDVLSSTGLNTEFELPALVSGNIEAMVSDGSRIWVSTYSVTINGNSAGPGSGGILQGTFNSSGGIDWNEGWSLSFGNQVNSMLMEGTMIYITTQNGGMYTLDTLSNVLQKKNGAVHDSHDGIALYQS